LRKARASRCSWHEEEFTISVAHTKYFEMDSNWILSVPAATKDYRERWTAGEYWKIYMQGATPKVEGLDDEADGNAKIAIRVGSDSYLIGPAMDPMDKRVLRDSD
jgi:hypothetical protein